MVDRRIVPDLRWIARRYPIYVTDGYSGPLPDGEHVGCHRCHVRGSDHYNGLAVDIVPVNGDGRCDATWAPISRLARWAEPRQNHPIAPFRWVGYNGDAGHGCGNHLHLSWNHSPAPEYHLAEWVEVFPAGFSGIRHGAPGDVPSGGGGARGGHPAAPAGPSGGVRKGSSGPAGGVSQISTGGLSPNGSGD